jgi:hypothetical protein
MAFVEVPPNSTGEKIDVQQVPDGVGNTVDRQVVAIGDPSTYGNRAAVDASGNLSVKVVTSPVPVRLTDGTNPVTKTFDIDTSGATHEWLQGISLRKSASGGSVEAGTSANPLRTDTTGTTTQPVSGTITANVGTTNGLALDASVTGLQVAQASATSGQKGGLVQGAVTTNAPTYTTAQTSPLSLDTSGLLRVSLKDTPVNTTALKVDGSAVTQPVSAASLPLPSGASTSAKQPALGTAGAASADVITIQGVASMTAVKVDGSAVTQPVSGTVTTSPPANASTNVAQISGTAASVNSGSKDAGTLRVTLATDQVQLTNALKVDGSAVTQPVSGTVTANIGTTNGLALDATLTGGTQKAILRGGAKGSTSAADVTSTASGANHQPVDVAIYDASGNQITSFGGGTQYADGTTQATPTGTVALGKDTSNVLKALPLDASGFLKVNVAAGGASGGTSSTFAAAFPGTGTAAGASDGVNMQPLLVDASGSLKVAQQGAVSVSGTTVGAVAPATGLQIGGNDGARFSVPFVDSSGTLNVNVRALPPVFPEFGSSDSARVFVEPGESTLIVMGRPDASPVPGSLNTTSYAGGLLNAHLVSAASANATSIKTGPGRVYGWSIGNTNAAARYVKLHNLSVRSDRRLERQTDHLPPCFGWLELHQRHRYRLQLRGLVLPPSLVQQTPTLLLSAQTIL